MAVTAGKMHRSLTDTTFVEPAIDKVLSNIPLTSPFSYTFAVGPPGMIKQAASQHPQGLTKLQHRLLYDSDSESSFDFGFSSPSSVGSTSEYSDVGYQSSSRSRTSSHGRARRAGVNASSSRSESISSVLSSSVAIQRVLMGTHTSTSSSAASSRQSVRSIANAFEQASRTGVVPSTRNMSGQLGRVNELSASIDNVRTSGERSSGLSDHTARRPGPLSSSLAHTTVNKRINNASNRVPARLNISKQPVEGPLSAPATITARTSKSSSPRDDSSDSSRSASRFVFPPRTAPLNGQVSSEPKQRVPSPISFDAFFDDDEPAFEIIPSPSRKRIETLPSPLVVRAPPATSARNSLSIDSDPSSSSLSARSRDSLSSNYSLDSVRGHPFSLQPSGEDERDQRASMRLDELDHFISPIGVVPDTATSFQSRQRFEASLAEPTTSLRSTAALQPLLLSASRPSSSSSSSTTLAPAEPVASSIQVTDDLAFPLPPFTASTNTVSPAMLTLPRPSFFKKTNVTGSPNSGKTCVDQATTMAELRSEAAALLNSISALSDEIDASIPPTHRLPGTSLPTFQATCRSTENQDKAKPAYVAVDESFADVWRCMDSWYWSSFEVSPHTSTGLR